MSTDDITEPSEPVDDESTLVEDEPQPDPADERLPEPPIEGIEPLSPFLAWTDADREPLDTSGEPSSSLVIQLVQAPQAVVERLADPRRAQEVTLVSVAMIAVGGSITSLLMTSAWGEPSAVILQGLLMVPLAMRGR